MSKTGVRNREKDQSKKRCAIKFRRNIFFLLFAGTMFFIGGEEISWGQRILGIATPEKWAAINAQKETTIHNLNMFQYSQLFRFNTIFNLCFLLYCLVIPAMNHYSPRAACFLQKINFPLPPLALCLLGVVVIFGFHQYIPGSVAFQKSIVEVKESGLEFVLMIIAVVYLLEINGKKTGHP